MSDGLPVPEPDIDDDPDDLMARRHRRPMWVKVGAVIMLFAAFALAVAIVARGNDAEPTSAGSVPHGGDLGAVDDPMALSERLGPELNRQRAGPDVGTSPPESVPCGDSESALPTDQAELVYSANLEWEGTPAVVLGYRLEGDGLSRVLLVMAEDDCRLLVTQSF